MKKIIIAGGTGFIGQYLIKHWLQQSISIVIIGRSTDKILHIFGKNPIKALSWQTFATTGANELHEADLIINLTGASIGEKRWSLKRKQEIIESRIQSTKLISSICSILGDKSPPWFNASAVGIYGLQQNFNYGLPKPQDESSALDFNQPPDFLSTVAREWEIETNPAKAHGVRVINLRFGIVLGCHGGALSQLILPFKFFIGGRIGTGKQPFPWIHIEDLYHALEFLFSHPEINGPVNLVTPQAITQQQFAAALGNVLNRPSWIPTPSFVLRMMFGEMANELLLSGQNVYPKILTEAHFNYRYPAIDTALQAILKQK